MADGRMPSGSGVRHRVRFRALAFGCLLLTGGTALIFGTGAQTAETAVATSLIKGRQSLAEVWGSAIGGATRATADMDRPTLHLTRLSGSIAKDGSVVGDEKFWLEADRSLATLGHMTLGGHVTFSVPAGPVPAGAASSSPRSYEIVEITPLVEDIRPVAAPTGDSTIRQSPRRLMLVVCRDVDGGDTPNTIRFLVDLEAGTGPVTAKSPPHAL